MGRLAPLALAFLMSVPLANAASAIPGSLPSITVQWVDKRGNLIADRWASSARWELEPVADGNPLRRAVARVEVQVPEGQKYEASSPMKDVVVERRAEGLVIRTTTRDSAVHLRLSGEKGSYDEIGFVVGLEGESSSVWEDDRCAEAGVSTRADGEGLPGGVVAVTCAQLEGGAVEVFFHASGAVHWSETGLSGRSREGAGWVSFRLGQRPSQPTEERLGTLRAVGGEGTAEYGVFRLGRSVRLRWIAQAAVGYHSYSEEAVTPGQKRILIGVRAVGRYEAWRDRGYVLGEADFALSAFQTFRFSLWGLYRPPIDWAGAAWTVGLGGFALSMAGTSSRYGIVLAWGPTLRFAAENFRLASRGAIGALSVGFLPENDHQGGTTRSLGNLVADLTLGVALSPGGVDDAWMAILNANRLEFESSVFANRVNQLRLLAGIQRRF